MILYIKIWSLSNETTYAFISKFIKFLFYNYIKMAELELGKRKFTKIDEMTFKIEENRHLESDINFNEQRKNMANALNEMRKWIAKANQIQEEFVKWATWYDEWCDIMNNAIDECGLDFKKFTKVNVPDCFDIIEAKMENLPKIELWNE